jgi:hypothetical protein
MRVATSSSTRRLGSAAAWPIAARAQQGGRVRRLGVLMSVSSDDAEGQARNAALLQGLGGLGWIVGRNVSIEYRAPTRKGFETAPTVRTPNSNLVGCMTGRSAGLAPLSILPV